MAEIAKRYQDSLERIKKNVETAYEYNKDNCDRWHEFRKLVFLSSMSDDDIALLKTLNKPQIEFNILEAYISRLRGEFAKQEPSISVCSDSPENIHPELPQIVEGHLRHILTEANNDGMEYKIYTDMLSGGFSVFEVYTDYQNSKSFKQDIKLRRVYDPTLTGFDPIAEAPHKGDGRYCFKLYPRSESEFKEEHPEIDLHNLKFVRNIGDSMDIGGFSWSYKNQKEKIIMVADYYEKKKKRVKIVELADGQTMTSDEYKDFLNKWDLQGFAAQPPAIINTRWTQLEKICRYRLIEDQVIEYVETEYPMLPLIFCDGNSVYLRENVNGSYQQYTRPYVYHAKGMQKLKNFAGQCIGNELENMVQHKFKVAKESIPVGYEDAYTNIQIQNTLIYNAFKDNDPKIPVPPPMEIARPPMPPEISNTFMMADQTMQSILGSYDASLGINNNQLSGVAITEGATQSNAAAMPYVVGFLQALDRAAQMIVAMLPKYKATPMSIPIIGMDGEKTFKRINDKQTPGSVFFDYDDGALNVKVEAGVNFSIQKSRSMQNIIGLMQASPAFAQFMNSVGLGVLLDNVEIRGIDHLKSMASQYMQQMQQQQQQQSQMAMQNNPMLIRAKNEQQKIAISAQQGQVDAQLKAAQVAVAKQDSDNERLKLMLEAHGDQADRMVRLEQQQTEKVRAAVDMAVSEADMHHRHGIDQHKAYLAHAKHERSEGIGDKLREREEY